MPSLSRDLRRQLEKTIAGENGARQIAEAGAEQSLQRLAVDRHEPHTSLTPDERTLRNQLRAHGRQLGDKRDPQRGTQSINHLKQAVAYEHWHRLLFARFLAENDLLLHPEHGVALSLDEVRELALDLKRDWIEVAAEYAQRMLLREVFRQDDPALRVPLPPEKRLELESRLDSLPSEVFFASDSLGWVYQFWQSEEKKRINKAELDITADELGPVTQLFTEDYMVLSLLENTLGAWWTARRGAPDLPGYTWSYLRLNDDGSPASGTYDGWPKRVSELKVLDPCMGSGHFLTFALPILVRMRVAEEGLSLPEAVAGVLRDNIFGLELDPRCSQIAAFNLALTAWKLSGQHFELPPLNLACSGLGINAKEEDWVKLAGDDGRKQDLMRWLYSMFRNAPTLGSLIDPRRVGKPMVEDEIAGLLPWLEEALSAERTSDDVRELTVAAQGLLSAARILAERFTLVATNVPYLGRGKQDDVLKEFCKTFHDDAKADLATCFVDRSLRLCEQSGIVALVTPHSWLFQDRYKDFRQRLLHTAQWAFTQRLGARAFSMITGEVVNISLIGISPRRTSVDADSFLLDVSSFGDPDEKARALRREPTAPFQQDRQLSNPDGRIVFGQLEDETESAPLLSTKTECYQGLRTGDANRFIRCFWEPRAGDNGWEFFQTSADEGLDGIAGLSYSILWQGGQGELARYAADTRDKLHDMHESGNRSWGKPGVAIGQMTLRATRYFGEKYDNSLAVITPLDLRDLPALFAFCRSNQYSEKVREIAHGMYVTNQSLVKIPFDLSYWKCIAEDLCDNGLTTPFSNDPTQWLFSGHPLDSEHPLQVAVARLLGFSWPRQIGRSFSECPSVGPDGLELHADEDGIVCLASVAGEENAAARLRTLLQSAYGADYNLARLLEGKKSSTLENWLRDEFFAEHCAVFQQRPLVWHIWDGLKDGFHALVSYHNLDRKNLEKLIYSYLGDWLTRQRQDVTNGVEGADGRLVASERLQGELKRILEGESPYDIFVRWKAIKEQPVGWEPDLNDGVRMNIRPWITEARLYNATKPGILRITPNIKYTKDRGKEPARDPKEFPWFKGSTDRINDHHLSLEEKRRARGLS